MDRLPGKRFETDLRLVAVYFGKFAEIDNPHIFPLSVTKKPTAQI
jgi:hypothetical protein